MQIISPLYVLFTHNIKLNTYKSIRQQFSVPLAVDYMHDQTHAVHNGSLTEQLYLYTYICTLTFFPKQEETCKNKNVFYNTSESESNVQVSD